MPVTFVDYVGDGTTTKFNINFNYISKDHVVVEVNGSVTPFTFFDDYTVEIVPAPAQGSHIRIRRQTPHDALVDFEANRLNPRNLNLALTQSVYIAEETGDETEYALKLNPVSGNYDAEGRRIENIGTPVHDADVATKGWADGRIDETKAEISVLEQQAAQSASDAASSASQAAQSASDAASSAADAANSAASAASSANAAATSETNAAASATNAANSASSAATSATNAANSASAAATSETNAANSASDAAGSASSAATSASQAASSATQAASSASDAAASASNAASSAASASQSAADALAHKLDFLGVYYGPLAADPSTDPNGNLPNEGDLFWHTGDKRLKTFDGQYWVPYSGVANVKVGDLLDWPDAVSVTEVGYLEGVTGPIQSQLDGKAAASHTHSVSDVTGLGSAATKNVPATGDAAAGEVVLGNDSRLTDARPPTAHSHSLSDITDAGTLAGKSVVDLSTGDAAGVLPIGKGGTGSTTASAALAALGGVPTTRAISVGTGLAGGGALSGDVTISANTLDQATWEAGTSTTEAVISPAKLAAAIAYAAPSNVLFETEADLAGLASAVLSLPDGVNEIDVHFLNVSDNATTPAELRLGIGSTASGGYFSYSVRGGSSSRKTSTSGFCWETHGALAGSYLLKRAKGSSCLWFGHGGGSGSGLGYVWDFGGYFLGNTSLSINVIEFFRPYGSFTGGTVYVVAKG